MKSIKTTMIAAMIPIMTATAFATPQASFSENVTLEAGLASNATQRVRATSEFGYSTPKMTYQLLGANEINPKDTSSFFGSNRLAIGAKNAENSALIATTASSKGIESLTVGVRNNSIAQKLGANYGFIEASANTSRANVTTLYGVSLGAKTTVDLFNSYTHKFNASGSKDSLATELQIGRSINKNFGVYARAEMSNLNIRRVNYVIGASVSF
jgi:hypothetical protein